MDKDKIPEIDGIGRFSCVRLGRQSGLSPCGIDCHNCEWFKGIKEPKCVGCKAVKGVPFWGICKTYVCAQEKNVTHCGLCDEFPCELFMSQYDPVEGPLYSVIRAGLLAYRVRNGDEKAERLTSEMRILWTDLLRNKEEGSS